MGIYPDGGGRLVSDPGGGVEGKGPGGEIGDTRLRCVQSLIDPMVSRRENAEPAISLTEGLGMAGRPMEAAMPAGRCARAGNRSGRGRIG